MKRIVVSMTLLLLALAMLLSVLSACRGKTPANPDGDDKTRESQTSGGDAIAPLEDRDLGGKTFNVLLRTEYKDEFDINEETNTPIPDAVYRRNQRVESKYKAIFKFNSVVDDWDHRDVFINAIHNSIAAGGESAYDFVFGAQSYIAFNIAQGDLLNLNTVPNLTFAGEWWGQQAVEALTVNDVCYQATGDFAISMLQSMNCVLFNKSIAAEFSVPDLYETVRNKKWTHDEMVRISKNIYTDLNNNGADAGDKFGLVMLQNSIRAAIVVYNTPTLTKEGEIVWNTERTGSVVTKIHDAFNNYEGIYYTSETNEPQEIFSGGRALFLWGQLNSASVMRDQKDLDYGIIPCPMFNEAQGAYYTTSNDASMVCIPQTETEKLDDIGFVIEAICRESTDTVAETVYEKSMKLRDAQDEKDSEMVDLIRQSLTYDFGWVYSTQTGVSGNQYELMMNSVATPDFNGWFRGQESVIKGMLKTFYEFFGVTLAD